MFIINKQYTKQDIYSILNVPEKKQKGPWNTGYVEFENSFYLFVNIGVAGRTGHSYNNTWSGKDLIWYGKSQSHYNQPIIQRLTNPGAKVHIFTREDDRAPFVFQGLGTQLKTESNRPIKITWKLPNHIDGVEPFFIDPYKAWSIFHFNISNAFENNQKFPSPERNNDYRITSIRDDKVYFEKLSAAQKREKGKTVLPDVLTFKAFKKMILMLSDNNGTYPKTKLKEGHVIIEAAMVWFLPMLDWDEDYDNIIYDTTFGGNIHTIERKHMQDEAKNDTQIVSVTMLKRLRRGQNKLRNLLLNQYQGKCCISECSVREVLNACHIEPHKISGCNDSQNALLLRSDIHDLWDMDLIGINPDTLKIHINDNLTNTEYSNLNAKPLATRKDGAPLNTQALTNRWRGFMAKDKTNRQLEK